MTPKKHGGLLMKIVQATIFQKKLTCLPLPQRFQNIFAHKNKH